MYGTHYAALCIAEGIEALEARAGQEDRKLIVGSAKSMTVRSGNAVSVRVVSGRRRLSLRLLRGVHASAFLVRPKAGSVS